MWEGRRVFYGRGALRFPRFLVSLFLVSQFLRSFASFSVPLIFCSLVQFLLSILCRVRAFVPVVVFPWYSGDFLLVGVFFCAFSLGHLGSFLRGVPKVIVLSDFIAFHERTATGKRCRANGFDAPVLFPAGEALNMGK